MNILCLHHYDLAYGSGNATRNMVGVMNSLPDTRAEMIAGRRNIPDEQWPHVTFIDYPASLAPFDLPLTGRMGRTDFSRYVETFSGSLRGMTEQFSPDVYMVNHGFVWGSILLERGIPYVLEIHGTDEEVFRSDNYTELKGIQKTVIENAATIICQCEDHKTRAAGTYGQPPERFTVMHGGIDTGFYSPEDIDEEEVLKELGIKPTGKPILSYVGRLSREKFADVLLNALGNIPDDKRPTALIVGDGALEIELKELASDLSLCNDVYFVGRKTPEELLPIYNASSVMVMPSVETFGLAVLEAMSCGTPVIGREVGGTRDTIAAFNSELVYDGTVEALTERIQWVLGSELKQEMKKELHSWVADHFDSARNIGKRRKLLSGHAI